MPRVSSLVGLCLVVGLVFQRLGGVVPLEARATLAVGFLLLSAFIAGGLGRWVGLPAITGSLLVGFLVGPSALGLVQRDEVEALQFLRDAALVLLALAAGSALRLVSVKSEWRLLSRLSAATLVLPLLAVALVVLAIARWLPVSAAYGSGDQLAIAILVGTIAAGSSPVESWPVIREARADGVVATTVLRAHVVRDVGLVVLFLGALAAAGRLASFGAADGTALERTVWRLLGSALLGLVLGGLMTWLLPVVKREPALLGICAALLTTQAARLLHLEPMLAGLVAGCLVANLASGGGEVLVRGLERYSLLIGAMVFGLAGAALHLDALAAVWPWVALLAAVRGASLFVATRWAARGGPDGVVREGWLGLVPQAGVSIGLAAVVRRAFPTWGVSLETLVVGFIVLHQMAGPPLLRLALRRVDEVREQGSARPATAPATA